MHVRHSGTRKRAHSVTLCWSAGDWWRGFRDRESVVHGIVSCPHHVPAERALCWSAGDEGGEAFE